MSKHERTAHSPAGISQSEWEAAAPGAQGIQDAEDARILELLMDTSEAPRRSREQSSELSMRETLACVDNDGKIRCPMCGRYSRFADIGSVSDLVGPGIRVSMLPQCKRCRAKAT